MARAHPGEGFAEHYAIRTLLLLNTSLKHCLRPTAPPTASVLNVSKEECVSNPTALVSAVLKSLVSEAEHNTRGLIRKVHELEDANKAMSRELSQQKLEKDWEAQLAAQAAHNSKEAAKLLALSAALEAREEFEAKQKEAWEALLAGQAAQNSKEAAKLQALNAALEAREKEFLAKQKQAVEGLDTVQSELQLIEQQTAQLTKRRDEALKQLDYRSKELKKVQQELLRVEEEVLNNTQQLELFERDLEQAKQQQSKDCEAERAAPAVASVQVGGTINVGQEDNLAPAVNVAVQSGGSEPSSSHILAHVEHEVVEAETPLGVNVMDSQVRLAWDEFKLRGYEVSKLLKMLAVHQGEMQKADVLAKLEEAKKHEKTPQILLPSQTEEFLLEGIAKSMARLHTAQVQLAAAKANDGESRPSTPPGREARKVKS